LLDLVAFFYELYCAPRILEHQIFSQCIRSADRNLNRWKVVGRVVGGPTTRPTTFNIWKTRGCQYSFRLLMMGSVSPETFWASNKYGIIKILIRCWILLHFLMNCTVLHGSSNIKSSASVSGLRIEIWTRELWNKKHRHYCQVHGPVTSTVVRNAFVTLISTKKIWFPFWDISDYEIF